MAAKKFRRREPKKPVGRLAGLLSGCMVALIGVFSGLDPFTIVCRALISAIAIGLTVSTGISVIRIANMPNETKAKV